MNIAQVSGSGTGAATDEIAPTASMSAPTVAPLPWPPSFGSSVSLTKRN